MLSQKTKQRGYSGTDQVIIHAGNILFNCNTCTYTLYCSTALAEGQSAIALDNSVVSDTYPHITALENAILGQSFPGQPLTDRLGRMEKKAFGSVSTKS